MKKIYKYGTGKEVPEGSIYLSSLVHEMPTSVGGSNGIQQITTRLVWHYFLVEVKEK